MNRNTEFLENIFNYFNSILFVDPTSVIEGNILAIIRVDSNEMRYCRSPLSIPAESGRETHSN